MFKLKVLHKNIEYDGSACRKMYLDLQIISVAFGKLNILYCQNPYYLIKKKYVTAHHCCHVILTLVLLFLQNIFLSL